MTGKGRNEMKKMKKMKKMFFLVCSLMLLSIPVSVQGAIGKSAATGAKLPTYKKVVTIKVGGSTFNRDLRKATIEASQNTDCTKQYKIVIQPGTYTLEYGMTLSSNIYIYAKGATLKGPKGSTVTFKCAPGKTLKNIKIEGGVWDATTQPGNYGVDTAIMRLAHVKNLVIRDAAFLCRRGGHILEFSDINGMTIKNCTLSGNTVYRGVQPKEAIQLDVATKPAMVNCTPYNGKGCHNVIIENNKFVNVARGVGSHNEMTKIVEKSPYTNITIRNNSFKNMAGEAVFVMYFKNCTIEKNTIYRAKRAGIYMESCSYNKIYKNTIKSISSFTGERKIYGTGKSGVQIRNTSNCSITSNTLTQTTGGRVYFQELTCNGNVVKGNK